MDIKIYEDQSGIVSFPSDTGEKIPNTLFKNSVDIFINKKGDSLIIDCHIMARKGLGREKGYYINYSGKYTDTVFSELKEAASAALSELELQIISGDIDNIIFENISKFDDSEYGYRDIDSIVTALNFDEVLSYKASNIDEIASLSKDILHRMHNVKIAISSRENKMGDVNILRNKKYAEVLTPTELTKTIIKKCKNRLVDNRKNEEIERGKAKLREGLGVTKEGYVIIENAGKDPFLILEEEISKAFRDITISRKEEVKEIKEERKIIPVVTYESEEPDEGGGLMSVIAKLGATVAVLVLIIFGSAQLGFIDLPDKPLAKLFGGGEKNDSIIPTPTVIPSPTKVVAAVPTVNVSESPDITKNPGNMAAEGNIDISDNNATNVTPNATSSPTNTTPTPDNTTPIPTANVPTNATNASTDNITTNYRNRYDYTPPT